MLRLFAHPVTCWMLLRKSLKPVILLAPCKRASVCTLPRLVHSPRFFRKIVEIERFAFLAGILDECQNDLVAAGNAKRSISTNLRKNRGL